MRRKNNLLWILAFIFTAGFFSGCSTMKGVKEDFEALGSAFTGHADPDNPMIKTDRWLRENWW